MSHYRRSKSSAEDESQQVNTDGASSSLAAPLPSPQMQRPPPFTTWTPPHRRHHIRSFSQPVDILASFSMQLRPPIMHVCRCGGYRDLTDQLSSSTPGLCEFEKRQAEKSLAVLYECTLLVMAFQYAYLEHLSLDLYPTYGMFSIDV